MGETFYSVLGVARDADVETIRQAYREKVKTHHPDVSDAEDAARTFQRITEARDVLVDESSRNRYDRYGHDAYVRRYLDSNAWRPSESGSGSKSKSKSKSDAGSGSTPGDESGGRRTTRTSGRTRSGSEGRRRPGGTGGRSSRGGSAGRSRSTGSQSRSARDGAGSGQRTRSGERSSGGRYGNPFDGRDGDGGWSGSGEADATENFEWSTTGSRSSDSASGSTARQGRARADGWAAGHAASNVYSPTGRDAGVSSHVSHDTASEVARQVGPWFAFHFVFLVSAFVTIWLLMTWTPSVPTVFVSFVLLGCAVFFSILHMVSRIYS